MENPIYRKFQIGASSSVKGECVILSILRPWRATWSIPQIGEVFLVPV